MTALTDVTQPRLAEISTRIRAIQATAIFEVGKLLIEAKELLPHGEFLVWAEREHGIQKRSAQNYMNAAKFAEGKSATVARLPPAILYRLAAPNAPAEIVADVVNADAVDASEIKRRLDEHKLESKELAAIQKAKGVSAEAAQAILKKKRRRTAQEQLAAQEKERLLTEQRAAMKKRAKDVAEKVAALCGDIAPELLDVLKPETSYYFAEALRTALAGAA